MSIDPTRLCIENTFSSLDTLLSTEKGRRLCAGGKGSDVDTLTLSQVDSIVQLLGNLIDHRYPLTKEYAIHLLPLVASSKDTIKCRVANIFRYYVAGETKQ